MFCLHYQIPARTLRKEEFFLYQNPLNKIIHIFIVFIIFVNLVSYIHAHDGWGSKRRIL